MQLPQYLSTPAEAGLDETKLNALRDRAREEVDDGLLPSAQIAIGRLGKVAFTETYGKADDDSLYAVFSCTKAIVSSAVWLLLQDGVLETSEIVADIIPEFASNEKDTITVEQVLLHISGFPAAPFRATDWDDRDTRLARFANWRLNWAPGEKFEYHPTSGMWVLAEIIERKTGMDFREYIRRRIIEPLNLHDFYVGLPKDENERVLTLEHVGDALTSEDYARLGVPEPPVTEVTEEAILSFNDYRVRAVGIPGGGGLMTAAGMVLFYQGLLHGKAVDGEQIWETETLARARTVLSGEYRDPLMNVPVNRSLGIVIAGDEQRNFRGFGHSNSPLAFGHGGAGGQVAWADPESGLSFCYVTNGHDRNPMRMGRRGVSISNKAAVLCK